MVAQPEADGIQTATRSAASVAGNYGMQPYQARRSGVWSLDPVAIMPLLAYVVSGLL